MKRFDRGNCTAIDNRRNFNLSAVIQSPHLRQRFLQWVAGDWQLSPIFGAHSGNYFAVVTGVDNALTGIGVGATEGGGQRPNQVTGDVYCQQRKINCWMSGLPPSSGPATPGTYPFTSPTRGTYGNPGNNSVVGPGYKYVF